MTLVRAQIPEGEYKLLRQRADASGMPIGEVIRLAIHKYLADEDVDAKDQIFALFPLGASGRRNHRTSERHDEELLRMNSL